MTGVVSEVLRVLTVGVPVAPTISIVYALEGKTMPVAESVSTV